MHSIDYNVNFICLPFENFDLHTNSSKLNQYMEKTKCDFPIKINPRTKKDAHEAYLINIVRVRKQKSLLFKCNQLKNIDENEALIQIEIIRNYLNAIFVQVFRMKINRNEKITQLISHCHEVLFFSINGLSRCESIRTFIQYQQRFYCKNHDFPFLSR